MTPGAVTVVGLGAIGSFLVSHLARSPLISRVTLIDRDRYDAHNVRGQDIVVRHIGRPKASVQARRLRRVNPALGVTSLCAAVEDVPLGVLRGSVILACLDSRTARMTVNQAAWRLGVPWVDAGINGGAMLARVRVFVPADDAPCLECGWDQDDYDVLEQAYPCGVGTTTASTNAPSMLGALAASLQAVETEKLLSDRPESALAGREVLLDARHHKHYVTGYPRNPLCRMPDHPGWQITRIDESASETAVDDILAMGSTLKGAGTGLFLGVAGQRVATELLCGTCGTTQRSFHLERYVRASAPRCSRCDRRLDVVGFGLHDLAPASLVPEDTRRRTLADLGFLTRDVFTLQTSALEAHFEIGG